MFVFCFFLTLPLGMTGVHTPSYKLFSNFSANPLFRSELGSCINPFGVLGFL